MTDPVANLAALIRCASVTPADDGALGTLADMQQFETAEKLQLVSDPERERQRLLQEFGASVVLIHPDSKYIGKSLHNVGFHSRYGLNVVGLRRGGKSVANFNELPLCSTDTLLVAGSWNRIARLTAGSAAVGRRLE